MRRIGIGIAGALRRLGTAAAAPVRRLDLRDVMIFGGIGLIGRGLWMILPWASLVAMGVLLFGVGMIASWRPRAQAYEWRRRGIPPTPLEQGGK